LASAVAEYDRQGISLPEPVPHPDEIVIDEATMEVRHNGLENYDEKAEWDQMLERKEGWKDDLKASHATRDRHPALGMRCS